MTDIYVDADACPMKDEVYEVASRHGLYVYLVTNTRMRTPASSPVELVLVEQGPDVADDWIAEHVRAGDVVVTGDIPLAARCLEAGASAIGTNGHPFDEDSIGGALATRELKSQLREIGEQAGGAAPLSDRDRSRFRNNLERLVQSSLSSGGRGRG